MKAAVIHAFGSTPAYEDFPDPVAAEGDVMVKVMAVTLENYDRLTARGAHYASRHTFPHFPAVVGHLGVGTLPDGKLVAFGGTKPPYGTMAERAVVPKARAAYLAPVPEGVAPEVAAALPSSAMTSLLPLRWGVKLEPGQSVLIQGATGVAGKLAVRIARLLGAGRIVATGRDTAGLAALAGLGADAIIGLKATDADVRQAFAREAGAGYDIILDYLWGHPTELMLQALTPTEAAFATHRTRYVQIGAAAGAEITLNAEALRTSGLELGGASGIPPTALREALEQIWTWVLENKLACDIETMPLRDIAQAWTRHLPGKRIVLLP